MVSFSSTAIFQGLPGEGKAWNVVAATMPFVWAARIAGVKNGVCSAYS